MRCIAIGVVVCGCGCVAGGTRCALSSEQHLMGLTFNQFTYSLSPTCLQKQHTREAGNRAHISMCVNVPVGGHWLLIYFIQKLLLGGDRNFRNEERFCPSQSLSPHKKIPELVELVGLASLVSYHISPFKVHLSF